MKTERQTGRGKDERCPDNLQSAKPDKLLAHFPEHGGLQFQPDQEQHHNHAEFCKMLHVGRFRPDDADDRPDHHTGDQITKHGAKTKRWLRGWLKTDILTDANELLDSGRLSVLQRAQLANSLLRRLDNSKALIHHW